MADVGAAIRAAGLVGRAVCLHASYRSFGGAAGSPDDLLDAFAREGCTVMVPTFSWEAHGATPLQGAPIPARNGWSPGRAAVRRTAIPFTPASVALDAHSMGAVAAAVLRRVDRARGNHPLSSFTATGHSAAAIVGVQDPEDVFTPLAALAKEGGAVLLAGVGLTTATLLHLAEQAAGRRMFVRWALTREGVIPTRVGGCSSGFERLARPLAPAERRWSCGPSEWRVYDAARALELVTAAISADPSITRCPAAECARCEDAIAGGPEV